MKLETDLLQIRVPLKLSKALRRWAKDNGESLTGLCRRVLHDANLAYTNAAPTWKKSPRRAAK